MTDEEFLTRVLALKLESREYADYTMEMACIRVEIGISAIKQGRTVDPMILREIREVKRILEKRILEKRILENHE